MNTEKNQKKIELCYEGRELINPITVVERSNGSLYTDPVTLLESIGLYGRMALFEVLCINYRPEAYKAFKEYL